MHRGLVHDERTLAGAHLEPDLVPFPVERRQSVVEGLDDHLLPRFLSPAGRHNLGLFDRYKPQARHIGDEAAEQGVVPATRVYPPTRLVFFPVRDVLIIVRMADDMAASAAMESVQL
jgi:hypothetical protein